MTTIASLAGADADLVTRGMTERARDNKCLARLRDDICRNRLPMRLVQQGSRWNSGARLHGEEATAHGLMFTAYCLNPQLTTRMRVLP